MGVAIVVTGRMDLTTLLVTIAGLDHQNAVDLLHASPSLATPHWHDGTNSSWPASRPRLRRRHRGIRIGVKRQVTFGYRAEPAPPLLPQTRFPPVPELILLQVTPISTGLPTQIAGGSRPGARGLNRDESA
jgi:hypothetical protein